MAALIRLVALLLTLAAAAPALGAIEVQHFDDPALQERYAALLDELRCPKCQNESIGSSNSPIAHDMRERTAAWLRQGRSDEEIRAAMVARFGEYVLYTPRLGLRTWLLWSLPGMLVVIGGGVVAALIRRRRRRHAAALSADERRRLAALLATHRDTPRDARDNGREESP